MKKFLCVILSILFCFPAWGASQKWLKYVNDRFGYSIEYPDFFTEQAESANGDGVWLKSKDGRASLTLSGGFNVLMQDGHGILDGRKTDNIVKKDSGSTWFRLVRYDEDRIIHEYGAVNEDNWASFTFSYTNTENFDTLIRHMEQSLSL